ncbi:hypothetical protein [Cupriavidus sp. D39]|uniref:hypothetical protein n=1 Tax=Cupriavidus sp. D39 TaxID=2997877 RepID=UPI00227147C5|nr:hypothetical protein [Cupriavidus sp. D39]MCY0852695.1 hypothetical protein [Cupriavidus sp. D39]
MDAQDRQSALWDLRGLRNSLLCHLDIAELLQRYPACAPTFPKLVALSLVLSLDELGGLMGEW